MTAPLHILACRNFHPEVAAAIEAANWEGVGSAALPARCGRPPLTWDEIRAAIPEGCGEVAVLGRACIAGLGQPPSGLPPVRIIPLTECFHLVAGPTLVAEAVAGGAYLITPAWLARWRDRLAELGFETADEPHPQVAEPAGGVPAASPPAHPFGAEPFFRDFARELLLLDTGIDPAAPGHLAEFSAAVGLPARRIPVGLDYTRSRLGEIVAQSRLEAERRAVRERDRSHARELADHLSAMDLLTRLAQTRREEEAIAAIEEVFRMLFAPESFHYLRVENGLILPGAPIPPELSAPLAALESTHAWTPSGLGFLLRIAHGDQVLGRVAVERLAFPRQRERYLNLALAISGVCGLAIANARARKRLVEAEKMASLAVLVAGVAHEINTPLGVGLTAASSLQESSRRLARRFADRAMTQSDLTGYLAQAESATGLLRANLERIGGLIDAFRQVAVDGRRQERSRFNLRACLEEVIRSLGDRLSGERIAILIDCDAGLEIESLHGDWVSIFTNLLANTLRHGLKGRETGRIEIRIHADGGRLLLDYRDDGAGMAPEVLAHLFDPFYTTDLQQGMGLGMHLVYNLVTHRLGGSIACASHPGEGVHFHIEIPP